MKNNNFSIKPLFSCWIGLSLLDLIQGGIMKKILLLCVSLSLVISLVSAQAMTPDNSLRALYTPESGHVYRSSREAPSYTFSCEPFSIITSYYDYMIGSYNSLPLQLNPDTYGGGYFLTYHGSRTPTGTRRVFYVHIDSNCDLVNYNEITYINHNEGYPGMDFDPVTGKPMYCWHANNDLTGADPELEVEFVSDAFIYDFSGLFNDIGIVFDNPTYVDPPSATPSADNEFIWPSLKIGPSPNPNMRRVYVLTRNSITHNPQGLPSENIRIAYADFDADMIESGLALTWAYTSIPILDQWNHDNEWRRPYTALTVDDLGNVYVAGYHIAYANFDNEDMIVEGDFDIFKCSNYGEGTWTHESEFSNIPTWNPPATPGGAGFFTENTPLPDEELVWKIVNSMHINAVTDNQGRVIVPALWCLSTTDSNSYWEEFHTVKAMIYDPADYSFTIREIYPQKNANDDFNEAYTPWDTEAPWGEAEYDLGENEQYQLRTITTFPFPHWNDELHNDTMYFYYNNLKLSEVNDEGMMVAVWQDSKRARNYGKNPDLYPEFADYMLTPEIFISVSSNQGNSWSEPIILNNVETPEFNGIKPMWVYPASEVKYVGMQGENKIGKIGLMFYDDATWGTYSIDPPAHYTNDGGQVMFAELEIVFPVDTYPEEDPFGIPTVLSGSMTLMAGVTINQENAAEGDVLAAYVTTDGIPELRGKETVLVHEGVPACLIQIYTEEDNEEVFFKLWDADSNEVLSVLETLPTVVNGTIGSWPDDLYWLNALPDYQQYIALESGWNMFSLNLHPADNSISNVMSDIAGYLEFVKSPEGIYEPDNPYSTLTHLSDGKGYFIRVTQPVDLAVDGIPIQVDTPISLLEGWNLAGFLPQTILPVSDAISSIADALIQIKGVEGVYEPGNPYNTLSFMRPGASYWVKLSDDALLIYPEPTRAMSVSSESVPIPSNLVLKSNSQSILLRFADAVPEGAQVMAWVDNELRGVAEIKQVDDVCATLLQVYTDSADEQITFQLLSEGRITSLKPNLQSSPGSIIGNYSESEYFVVSEAGTESPIAISSLGKAYPNPFTSTTSIILDAAKDTEIKIHIYNIRGQKVKTLVSGKINPGRHILHWDGTDASGRAMPSGVYFCRMQQGNTMQNRKIILMK